MYICYYAIGHLYACVATGSLPLPISTFQKVEPGMLIDQAPGRVLSGLQVRWKHRFLVISHKDARFVEIWPRGSAGACRNLKEHAICHLSSLHTSYNQTLESALAIVITRAPRSRAHILYPIKQRLWVLTPQHRCDRNLVPKR